MIEHFSTTKKNGREYAEKMAHDLEEQGYEILEIEEGMVPQGTDAEGETYYVLGYRIIADNGKPPLYKGYVFDEAPITVNENLQDPPGMNVPVTLGQDKSSAASWLWGD